MSKLNKHQLSNDQTHFLDAFKSGKNLLLTGCAGTGKSFLLNQLKVKFPHKQFAFGAPTGLAAMNIEGVTLHRMFWLPIGSLLDGFEPKTDPRLKETLEALDVLVIDECSMMRVDIFEAIWKTLEVNLGLEKTKQIQWVLVGDLYQLPPVIRNEENESFKNAFGGGFFFLSLIFRDLEFEVIELESVFRQADQTFISALAGIRKGEHLRSALALINRHDKASKDTTILTTTNATVDRLNRDKILAISAPEYVYHAMKEGKVNRGDVNCERTLVLKRGARVMTLINSDDYINGDKGTVIDLDDGLVTVQLDRDGSIHEIGFHKYNIRSYGKGNDGKIGTRISSWVEQIPLKPAYALTVHKSQGQTLSGVHLDLSTTGAFAPGQIYVALSRCSTLDGLSVESPIKPSDVIVDSSVEEFYTQSLKQA
jgi:ATP-dependent DNA helicase PIF1